MRPYTEPILPGTHHSGPLAPGAARRLAGQTVPYTSPAPPQRRSRAILIWLSVVVLVGVVIGALYLAYQSQWIGLFRAYSGMTNPLRQTETVIFSGHTNQLSAAPGNLIQLDASAPSLVWIRSSLTSAKSSGTTDGISVKVPSTLSSELGGKRIRVTVSAGRSAKQPTSLFAMAYSTEAGDSGWFVFQPTPELKDFSFDYRVPRRAAGTAHYVGIWSDIAGQNAPLAIRRVTITVAP